MDFQNVLKENNSQPSLQKLNGSLSEADAREHLEATSDVLKENYNPKSLSEIATDKSSKLNTPVSENYSAPNPKITKTVFKSQDSSDCDPDCSIDITPSYAREPLSVNQQDISLGFLTEGFNKLDLDRRNSLHVADLHSNSTFSDDEEQFVECQSFSDLSNRSSLNTTDVLMKTIAGNVTITKESGGGDGTFDFGSHNLNSTETAVDGTFDAGTKSLNSTQTPSDGTFFAGTQNLNTTTDISADGTFDADTQNLNSSQIPADGTFDAESQNLNSSKAPADGTFNAETHSLNSTQTSANGTFTTGQSLNSTATVGDVAFDQVEPRTSTESSENFGSCSPSSKTAEEVAQRDIDFIEPDLSSKHELHEATLEVPPAEPEQKGAGIQELENKAASSTRETNKPVEVPQPEMTMETPKTEAAIEDISSLTQPEADIQQVKIEEAPAVEIPSQEASAPDDEEYFQNIDEFSKSQTNAVADKMQATFVSEPMQQESEENPFSPVTRATENVFFDKVQSQFDVEFKKPAVPVFKSNPGENFADDEFNCGSSYNFADSDFDYLQKVGSSKAVRQSLFQRDSLLLKFDPLCAQHPTPSLSGAIDKRLTATTEEDDFIADLELKLPQRELPQSASSSANNSFSPNASHQHDQSSRQLPPAEDESMSVEIMKDISVEHKTSESNHIEIEETKLSSHNYEENHLKMAELENKIKKEAEIREEALLKRISEKDKQISKMNGVVEAYEKAISELIAEKEQLVQSYEKKCNDLKYDSEQNAHHLTSLETTFSDLHSKYERTKQITVELRDREEHLVHDRKTLTDNLKMQEARYEKMKSHAMSQLEIANTTLADLSRNHNAEVTKLKALLKKEEVSRASVNEQLIQKTKENSELVKICDELINGTQSS